MNFDECAEKYQELLDDNLRRWGTDTLYYAERKVQDVQRHALNIRPSTILEFGCGVGRNISCLRDCFPESRIFGTDISSASLAQAQKNNPDCSFFLWGSPFEERFDLIFVACVFHHVPPRERDDVMLNMKSCMHSGSEIFIFEHNPYNPVARHAVNSCEFDRDAILLYPGEMERIVTSAGLALLGRRYLLFLPASLKRYSRLEEPLASVPLGGQYVIHAKR